MKVGPENGMFGEAEGILCPRIARGTSLGKIHVNAVN